MCILLIATASFFKQTHTNVHEEHMGFLSRIWQFMFGFLAYEIHQISLYANGRKDSDEILEQMGMLTFYIEHFFGTNIKSRSLSNL